MSNQKLGELNGVWAMLFKVKLVLMSVVIPIGVGWGAWVTSSVTENDKNIALNQKQIAKLEDADRRLEALAQPPAWLLQRIDKLERGQEATLNKLDQIIMQTKENK